MPRQIIIDCDPGVDDAVALFLAFAAPDALDILGVTTVAGNVGGALTARNARLIREVAGRTDVPVIAGCERPMVRAPIEAEHFHGESGLGDVAVFEPAAPAADGHAVRFLVDTIMRSPAQSISLAVTGPMTNIAMALVLEPRLAGLIAEIAIMGGARSEGGNITASAEYNIYADPHAAHVVFSSGAPIVAFGLDVTHQVRTTPARLAALRALGTPAAAMTADVMAFSARAEREHADRDGAPLHDPCTIAWFLEPKLFRTRPCHIAVETASPLTLGHTAVTFTTDAAPSTRWATDVDDDGVFALLNRRLRP